VIVDWLRQRAREDGASPPTLSAQISYLGRVLKTAASLWHLAVPVSAVSEARTAPGGARLCRQVPRTGPSPERGRAGKDPGVNRTEQDGKIFMSVQYFQFSQNDDGRKLHTLSLLHIFVATLDVFPDFMVTEVKVVPAEWKTQLHQLGATIERHLEQLREKLRNEGENSTAGQP
jgi:hypothetical protein